MSHAYPHMCRDGHPEIGHRDSEHKQCPLCIAQSFADQLQARLDAAERALREARGAIKIAASYAGIADLTAGLRLHANDCARVLPIIDAALAQDGGQHEN